MLLASFPSPSTGVLNLGPFAFRAYGLCIALGVLAAVRIAGSRYKAQGGDPDAVGRICWWAVPAGLIGARMYHVATDHSSFNGRWLDAFKIWQGGLGILGGVFLGTLVGCIAAKRYGERVVVLIDCTAVALPVAQAIGRVGNYFNQELFGRPTTLPWALRIDDACSKLGNPPDCSYTNHTTFQPTFLYEALWCFGIAVALVLLSRRFAFKPGQLFALYLALYAVGRFYFETLRIDNATHVGGLRINEIVVPAVGLLASMAFVALGLRKAPEGPVAEGEPDPVVSPERAPEVEPAE